MGLSATKPEFVLVLADKQVKLGGEVTLSCEANMRMKDVTANWEKNRSPFQCVMDKHQITQQGSTFSLIIKQAEREDEGTYTITLSNKSGSASCSAMVIVELNEWREVKWKQDSVITPLRNFKISNGDVKKLRFLLHGPVGAGKSSIINTIKTIFEEHQFINCLAASDLAGESFTTKYKEYTFGSFPFAFFDVMGLEETSGGVQLDDIIKAFKGHIPNNYEFQPDYSMSEDNRYYITNPTLNDQIHCLISVVAADKIAIMNEGVIQKMKTIRAEASKLDIPQLVFLTRVDKACQMVQKDVTKVYQSKRVKEKMHECSNRLGVPMNCIFPIKSYHEETKANNNLNCLMLDAMTQAVHSANDFVRTISTRRDVE